MRLSGLDLARMRRRADDHLPASGEIQRPVYSSDSQGGKTVTRSRVWSGPVRVAPISSVVAADSVVAERLGGAQGVWITLAYYIDLRLDDRIIVGSRTYEVVGFDDGRSWHVSKRALAKELL